MSCDDCIQINARVEELTQQIEWLKRQLFGRKADKARSKRLQKKLVADSGSSLAYGPHMPRVGHGTTKLPISVPRVIEIISIDESKRICSYCQRPMTFLDHSDKRETSIIPQHVRERIHRCEVYGCIYHPEQTARAVPPARAIEGLGCDHKTQAYIMTQKLVMSIPIERQAEQFAGAGTPIAASTMNRWALKTCAFFSAIADADRAHIESSNIAFSDDTSFRVQDKEKIHEKVHLGSFYFISNGTDAAFMRYCQGRTDASAKEILGSFQGVLVADGLKGYKKIPGVFVAACWAHIRRYFVESLRVPKSDTGDRRAQIPVDLMISPFKLCLITETYPSSRAQAWPGLRSNIAREIRTGALFEIDSRCRKNKASYADLQAIRDAESRPVLDAIRAWLDANVGIILPKCALGKAIAYLDARWDDACRFLTDAKIPLDNNLSERALRKPVLGRKNFLFAGNAEAAQVIANAYGVMASCTLCKVDPCKYVEWALDTFANERISSYEALTPRKYAALFKVAVP